jgi:hypothetical protein
MSGGAEINCSIVLRVSAGQDWTKPGLFKVGSDKTAIVATSKTLDSPFQKRIPGPFFGVRCVS